MARDRGSGSESQNLLTTTWVISASVGMPPSIGRAGASATAQGVPATPAVVGCGLPVMPYGTIATELCQTAPSPPRAKISVRPSAFSAPN